MSKDPAFLFYSKDFLTGVSDLTMEERGQYITLLCMQHQKGRLSKKAIDIAVASISSDVLSKFKQDKSGNFYNSRLEVEAEKRRNHSKKQSDRAKRGWEKRKKEKEAAAQAAANATALPLVNVNVNEIVNRDILLQQWLDYRVGIKKEVKNEKTLEKLTRRFQTEPMDKLAWVVNHSVENQYQGLFWEKKKKKKHSKPKKNKGDEMDNVTF